MTRREKLAHIHERETNDHYVEPFEASWRLFEAEQFYGTIYDPACGWGRIVQTARGFGCPAVGTDLVRRTPDKMLCNAAPIDFLHMLRLPWRNVGAIVCNPPFKQIRQFCEHAVSFDVPYVAMLAELRRLPASGAWLEKLPLKTIWIMTPRPSIPTGEFIKNGGKVGGGSIDFVWLVMEKGYTGRPETRWLRGSPAWKGMYHEDRGSEADRGVDRVSV
jgi:hypothetical protein